MTRGYVRNPEPYKDPSPHPLPERHRPQNPFLHAEDQRGDLSTEFGFGPGPVAPHLNGKSPEDGGLYRPRAPRVDPPPSGVGPPRLHRRSRDEARGYPGEQVAR
jgi:hypothetical protein